MQILLALRFLFRLWAKHGKEKKIRKISSLALGLWAQGATQRQ
jgi:hypothetical protein